MLTYIKMPPPFTVLGFMYVIYAVLHMFNYLKDGYWQGLLVAILNCLLSNLKIILLVVFILLLSICFIDQIVFTLCNKFYNVYVYTITDFISSMGEGWFIVGFLFTLSLIEDFRKHYNNAIAFRIAFMSSLFAGLVNSVLKFIFNRERPVISTHQWHFFKFFMAKNKHFSDLLYAYNSMPSGHTVMLVSAITVLYLYFNSRAIKFFLISLAVLMAYSRVYTVNHWFSDVLMASILGVIIGIVGYDINKRRFKGKM